MAMPPLGPDGALVRDWFFCTYFKGYVVMPVRGDSAF